MNWKYRQLRHTSFALLGALMMTALYIGLERTRQLHGFAVSALGPAVDLVWHHLDANCYRRPYCRLEIAAGNVFLYTLLIWIVLTVADLLARLKQRMSRRQ